jgi:Family of unknown function (DUF6941)
MPELDFMVTADYVRVEGGVLHMIAAGFDTVWTPTVPAVRQVGVGLRILVDVAEAREVHRLTLLYQDADGQVLFRINGTFGPVGPGQPLPAPGRPYGVPLGFNLPLPLPAFGDYSLELFLDDEADAEKSITLTVAASADLQQPPGNA